MYRPNGIAVVTTGLGALVLLHGVWNWGTRRAEPWPQQVVPTPRAALDIGTNFQLHSGAWRAWPAPVEEAPASAALLAPAAPAAADVALPVPQAPTTVPAGVPLAPVRSVPIQPIAHPAEPPTPSPQARAAGQFEPSALPADKAPAVPTLSVAEGRMALAGPEAEAAHRPSGHPGRSMPMARSAPSAHERDPEVDAAAPSQSKFGPEVFKQFDRNRF